MTYGHSLKCRVARPAKSSASLEIVSNPPGQTYHTCIDGVKFVPRQRLRDIKVRIRMVPCFYP